VSRQLAIFFVSDTPPEPLVQGMAQAFRATDGDIVSVLLVMFKSPDFANARKFKDPMQFVLSAVRLAYDTKVIQNPAAILGWLNRMAQGLYNHPTPDGYPMTAAAWNGPGQMAVRVPSDRKRALLQCAAVPIEFRDPRRARPGDIAAGVERALLVVA